MAQPSYAKANLYLKIGKKLKSGYHPVQSFMQLLQLHDVLTFEKLREDRIIIDSTNRELATEDNLVYKAASLLKETYHLDHGIKVHIEKNIPISAGLGGGSSNAALALITLNRLWNLKLSQKKLIEHGLSIGSDVPFFIMGQSAIVEGIGEKVKPIPKATSLNILIVNPGIKVATTWAYDQFDKFKGKSQGKASLKALVAALQKKDIKEVARNIHNDFDEVIESKHKVIREIKSYLRKFGALNSMVVGSGPTVMGIYDSIYTTREAYFKVKDLYPFVYLTKTF